MNAVVLFLIILLGPFSGRAQTDSVTDDILTTSEFRTGIYMDYDAFRKNLPTVDKGYKIVADTGKFDRYYLLTDKGRKVRNAYGFSDGSDLYLNAQIYCDFTYYVKILSLGSISYFEDKAGKSSAMSSHRRLAGAAISRVIGGPVGGIMSAMIRSGRATGQAGWVIYLGDTDGQAYLFDYKTLLSIFKDASRPLYDRLKEEKEKDKFEVLMRYVEEFNKRDQK